MVATHRLNIALRKSITKSLCYLADMALYKLNKVTFSSTGKSTPPPGLTKCTATPVPTRRYSEVAGIKTTPAAQGSSTGTPDCHATYLSTMKKDAGGKLGSEVLYKMYKEKQREEREEAASKRNATKDRDTPKRKNAFEPIAEFDLEQYCKSG